jgi:hypothetical protein
MENQYKKKKNIIDVPSCDTLVHLSGTTCVDEGIASKNTIDLNVVNGFCFGEFEIQGKVIYSRWI